MAIHVGSTPMSGKSLGLMNIEYWENVFFSSSKLLEAFIF